MKTPEQIANAIEAELPLHGIEDYSMDALSRSDINYALVSAAVEARDTLLASFTRPEMQGVPREIWAAAMAMQLVRDGWSNESNWQKLYDRHLEGDRVFLQQVADALHVRTDEVTTALLERLMVVRESDVKAALKVLNRSSSSLGDYREALKTLVGWAE